jgi:pimeloyl-ACP methyl ester carboxylesterase
LRAGPSDSPRARVHVARTIMHRSAKALFLTALLGLSIPLAAVLAAEDKPANKGEFLKAFAGPDSYQAALAVQKLNPDLKADYDLLKFVLEKGSWYLRAQAVNVLAKTGNDKNQKDMLECLTEKGSKDPFVRQGMAAAIAKMNDRTLYPELFKALSDKDPRVRREAAYVLRINKDKGSIEALIARWKEEKDPLVINYIRATLEDITKRFLGPNQVDWYNWWIAVKDSFEVGSTDEEAAKKAEEEGKKLSVGQTTTRDVDVEFVSRGIGMPIIVLPHYGQSKELMIPFFIEVEKFAKVAYMDIPMISSFKNVKAGAGGIPYYPIDPLVEAFEKFRETTKFDKMAILACGMDSWIAMRYATKYPKHVAALIFVSPISSEAEYGHATDRIKSQGQKSGDLELEHFGLTRTVEGGSGENTHDKYHKDKKLAVPEGEPEAIDRKEFTIYFADQNDSLLDQLYPVSHHHPGSVLIPPFKVSAEPKTGVPAIVLSGKHAIYTSEGDCAQISKYYGCPMVSFDRSADLPFIEEPEKFSKTVKEFLLKYVPKPEKKEKEKS